jgi:hypothetical protein
VALEQCGGHLATPCVVHADEQDLVGAHAG